MRRVVAENADAADMVKTLVAKSYLKGSMRFKPTPFRYHHLRKFLEGFTSIQFGSIVNGRFQIDY